MDNVALPSKVLTLEDIVLRRWATKVVPLDLEDSEDGGSGIGDGMLVDGDGSGGGVAWEDAGCVFLVVGIGRKVGRWRAWKRVRCKGCFLI